MNDLPDKVENFVKMFADDSKIYTAVNNINEQNNLQKYIDSLCVWSSEWLMKFNATKCKCIQFGNVKHKYKYNMTDSCNDTHELPFDNEECDLGIIFQQNLKFDTHITKKTNKANQLLGMIKRTFTFMDKTLFLCIYKSLIRSILDYGSPVWNPSSKNLRQMLENVQRRSTKIVPGLKTLSHGDRLRSLNLPTLYYRRKRFDLIQMFKIVHGYEKVDIDKFFTFNDNNTRGHIFQIMKVRCNKSLRLNSFPHRCINDWNKLPEDIVISDSVNSFKNKLDKLWYPYRFSLDAVY